MTGEGFPQTARVKQSSEFRRIQKCGRRFHTEFFVVCFVKNPSSDARFGLTVSRKVGNAVTRNRVKRWLRESIRRSRASFSSHDVVFIAKTSAAQSGLSSIQRDVSYALRKILRESR